MGNIGMEGMGVGPSLGVGMGTSGIYNEALALAQSGAMQPVMEMQTRVAELQFKLESLESDLR